MRFRILDWLAWHLSYAMWWRLPERWRLWWADQSLRAYLGDRYPSDQ